MYTGVYGPSHVMQVSCQSDHMQGTCHTSPVCTIYAILQHARSVPTVCYARFIPSCGYAGSMPDAWQIAQVLRGEKLNDYKGVGSANDSRGLGRDMDIARYGRVAGEILVNPLFKIHRGNFLPTR